MTSQKLEPQTVSLCIEPDVFFMSQPDACHSCYLDLDKISFLTIRNHDIVVYKQNSNIYQEIIIFTTQNSEIGTCIGTEIGQIL